MLRAKKSLGQNFLVDENICERIVRQFAPRANETVIEIGAGQGALTDRLIGQVGRLITIEFDRDLVPPLRERFAARENFMLVEGDALTFDFCALLIAQVASARVIANLPYNVSTAILGRLIEQRRCITEMLLMLQREVVERITAPPNTSERGFLSVLVEAYCETHKVFDVAPGAFRPVPKVWSTVVHLRVRPRIAADVKDENLLWNLVSTGFAQRRKTLFNNLRNAPTGLRQRVEGAGGASRVLVIAEIEPQRRAETLAFGEWARLANILSN